ncbi:probable disease resistance protein At1g61300 [Neltuma alba]|uniref:probable disease resistance protein At1g61300 n=1 Tax=Neltuma alba TaxID=207710 RepID=UPI0010A59999|nr:probable disease resistance protein At1g61300 [Prosopis alba]
MNGIRNTVSALGEMGGELVTQVALEVSGDTFKDKLRAFTTDLEDKYEDLQQRRLLLHALRKDLEREVQRCREKETTSSYSLWITKASEVDEEVNDLVSRYEAAKQASYGFLQRPSLSSEVEEKLKAIKELVEQKSYMVFQVDKPPERVLKVLNAPRIAGYPTLQGALEKVLELVKNSKIKAIGVHGLKGVGKTAIMQNLNNHEEADKLFDIVIFVGVPDDEIHLQQKIARRLKVDAKGINDTEDIARKIHKELKNKRYLLILDGVVDSIDLSQLGIPNNDNYSKVVVTAQHKQVCTLNDADRLIKVEQLSRDEAWKMFRDTVGPKIDRPDIPEIAQRVCDKCSGLPLLIHKIARSFKLKGSAPSWRAGLEDLEERWPDYENEGVNELYSFLTFCYDDLKDEKKQKCFLYASSYPADSKVYSDYLVECLAAQNFLGDINGTRKYQNARDRGYAILEDLTNVSLLEKGKQMIYVSMNDCMKQLASYISSKYPQYSSYVQTGEELGEPETSKSWQNARWVSLINSNLQTLPIDQDCSMLETLLLQKNPELSKIPGTFFKKHMRNLVVLDMYGTGIKSLPSSVSKLTGLRGLYLNDCERLTMLNCGLRSLERLEFLDIRGTKVPFLSSDIGYLTNLRCLRIPYIKIADQSEDPAVNANYSALSRLQKLEELIIEVVSYQEWCNDAANVMQQLAYLENLTNLRFSFPTSTTLQNLLTRRAGKQFSSFQFFVGCQNSKRPSILESFEYRISRYLRYNNGGCEDTPAISAILPQTDALELINCNHVRDLSNLGTESLERIRGILIEKCNEIHTLLPGTVNGTREVSILPNLEQLHLINLRKLNCVFRGPFHQESLSKLRALTLKDCSSLKYIFGDGAIQHFSQLHFLEVQNCSDFEELIAAVDYGSAVLPKLEVLVLANLPRLKSVYIDQTLPWSSLEVLKIYQCSRLKSLPLSKERATNLRSIKGEQEWWDELQWADKEHFQHIFTASSGC